MLKAKICALMCLVGVLGCDPSVNQGRGVESGCFELHHEEGSPAESPVALELCPIQDDYDQSSVPIFVGIRNRSASPQLVEARFDVYGHLDLHVVDEDGIELREETRWDPGTVSADVSSQAQWLLPLRGIVGRIVDLTCEFEDLSVVAEGETCHPLFPIRPGRYTIMAEARSIRVCGSVPCPANEWRTISFRSDSIEIEVGP